MTDSGSRRGAASLAVPLMIVALLALVGFMFWLHATAEPTTTEVVETGDSGDAGMMAGTLVDPGSLVVAPEQFVGQEIRLTGVSIAQAVGSQAFFLDLPQSPFLVRMDSTLVARGMTVPVGSVVDVSGILHEMTDSIVEAWVSEGVVSEADRMIVEFSTHFIEAEQVQTSGG